MLSRFRWSRCAATLGSLALASLLVLKEGRALEPLGRDTRSFWAASGTSLQWWYLTGPLWSGNDCDETTGWSNRQDVPPLFGAQTTFFYRGAGQGQQGLMFHGALSDVGSKSHDYGSMFEVWTAGAMGGLVGWARSIGPGHGPSVGLGSHQIVALTSPRRAEQTSTIKAARLDPSLWLVTWLTPKFEVRLVASAPVSRLWKHGDNGWVKKSGDLGNTYVSLPFMPARGQVRSRTTGQTHEVCGSLWFDHEVDVKEAENLSWQWFALRFPDGRAYMVYKVFSKKSVSSQSASQGRAAAVPDTVFGEVFLPDSTMPVILKNVRIVEGAPAVCLKSGRCYPQVFTLSFEEGHETRQLQVSAFFEEQEVATGLGKTYWEGLVGVVDDRGSRGLGYVELTE